MRALVTCETGVELVELPAPAPPRDGVVVAVHTCGICGSDVHRPRSGPFASRHVLGHELSGTLLAIGPEVRGLHEGQPVVVNPLGGCGSCVACRRDMPFACAQFPNIGISAPGGFADEVAVRAAQVLALPDGMAIEDGAHVEPLAVALNALGLAGVAPGDACVVFGVGPIGLNVVLALRAAGAGTITAIGRSPGRRRAAAALGADLVLDSGDEGYPETLARLDGTFEHAFECSGAAEAMSACIGLVGFGGTVVELALPGAPVPIELRSLVGRGVRIIGSCAFGPVTFERALALAAGSPEELAVLVSERVPIEEGPEAFRRLEHPGELVGVLVQPWRTSERIAS